MKSQAHPISSIYYLGPSGSYSQQATQQLLSELNFDINVTVPCTNFEEIFEKLENDLQAAAIIPIENSIGGNVNPTFEQLLTGKYYILAETEVEIKHCLMALPGTKIDQITEVLVHPQAALQCSYFLASKGWKQTVMPSTSAGAEKISQNREKNLATLASPQAAKQFELEILNDKVANVSQNRTRFLLFVNAKSELAKVENSIAEEQVLKYSLLVNLAHKPKSLVNFLNIISEIPANMTKIESIAIPEKPWHFSFYIDFIAKNDFDFNRLIKSSQKFELIGRYKPAKARA